MKNKYVPYLLLLPAFLLICIFKIYPVLTTLRQAFVVDGALSLATFQRVFSEKTFWNCLKGTMKFNDLAILDETLLEFPCEGKTYAFMNRMATRYNDLSIVADRVCPKYEANGLARAA